MGIGSGGGLRTAADFEAALSGLTMYPQVPCGACACTCMLCAGACALTASDCPLFLCSLPQCVMRPAALCHAACCGGPVCRGPAAYDQVHVNNSLSCASHAYCQAWRSAANRVSWPN